MAFKPPRYNGPNDALSVAQWVDREFGNLESTLLRAIDLLNCQPQFNAPDKPRDGDVRFADGTSWNPGGGEGLYVFYNNTWNKLG